MGGGGGTLVGFSSVYTKTTSDLYSPSHPCQCGCKNVQHGRRNGKCYARKITPEGYEETCSCMAFRPKGGKA
ncbi:MAG: hypothetical protein ACREAW_10675 [Nitrososphaera sp.]